MSVNSFIWNYQMAQQSAFVRKGCNFHFWWMLHLPKVQVTHPPILMREENNFYLWGPMMAVFTETLRWHAAVRIKSNNIRYFDISRTSILDNNLKWPFANYMYLNMIFISKSQGFVSDRDNFDIMHWPFAPLTFKPRFAINYGNKKSPCKKIHCNTNNKQINPQKSKFLFTATSFW